MLELYTNIKNRRLELHMTQQELAEKVGYTRMSDATFYADFWRTCVLCVT